MAFSCARSLYPLTVMHGKHAQDVHKERERSSLSCVHGLQRAQTCQSRPGSPLSSRHASIMGPLASPAPGHSSLILRVALIKSSAYELCSSMPVQVQHYGVLNDTCSPLGKKRVCSISAFTDSDARQAGAGRAHKEGTKFPLLCAWPTACADVSIPASKVVIYYVVSIIGSHHCRVQTGRTLWG